MKINEMTKNTSDFTTITITADGRHTEKYVIKNVVTNNEKGISYKTLDEIIQHFKLNFLK